MNNSEVRNNSITPKSLSQLQLRFEQLEKEYGPVGVLLSSKALVQLVANPVVGYLTGILGYNIPLVVGSTNLLVACLRKYFINLPHYKLFIVTNLMRMKLLRLVDKILHSFLIGCNKITYKILKYKMFYS